MSRELFLMCLLPLTNEENLLRRIQQTSYVSLSRSGPQDSPYCKVSQVSGKKEQKPPAWLKPTISHYLTLNTLFPPSKIRIFSYQAKELLMGKKLTVWAIIHICRRVSPQADAKHGVIEMKMQLPSLKAHSQCIQGNPSNLLITIIHPDHAGPFTPQIGRTARKK